MDLGVGVERLDVRLGLGEHAAGAARAVVDRANRRRAGPRLLVRADEQVDHQPDHLARGEVCAGLVVGGLGELADELLERVAHLQVADLLARSRSWRTPLPRAGSTHGGNGLHGTAGTTRREHSPTRVTQAPACQTDSFAGAPVALVDHARAERPGFDQVGFGISGAVTSKPAPSSSSR